MSRLKFLPPQRLIPPETPAEEAQVLAQVRQRSRTNLKDIAWVAVGLALIAVVGMVYQSSHDQDRRAAERQAQLRATTTAALPPPGYDPQTRYPSAGEMEADANVREARALLAANAADNAADPMLKTQPQPAAPIPLPMSPKPFSDPNYAAGTLGQPTPAAPPPAAVRPATPAGPPR